MWMLFLCLMSEFLIRVLIQTKMCQILQKDQFCLSPNLEKAILFKLLLMLGVPHLEQGTICPLPHTQTHRCLTFGSCCCREGQCMPLPPRQRSLEYSATPTCRSLIRLIKIWSNLRYFTRKKVWRSLSGWRICEIMKARPFVSSDKG